MLPNWNPCIRNWRAKRQERNSRTAENLFILCHKMLFQNGLRISLRWGQTLIERLAFTLVLKKWDGRSYISPKTTGLNDGELTKV
jgi:hypothetical protein